MSTATINPQLGEVAHSVADRVLAALKTHTYVRIVFPNPSDRVVNVNRGCDKAKIAAMIM